MSDPLELSQVPIDELRPDPANPRQIDPATLDALTRSVRQFGLVDPLIARRENGQLIGGHQRWLAARRAGLDTLPVIYLDLPEPEARLLALALNQISGTWDGDLLGRLLEELQTHELDLSLSGFGEDEIDRLLATLTTRERRDRPESFDLADAVAQRAQRTPRVQPGDTWQLGPHRLRCGDATTVGDVDGLIGSAKAAMAFTDPPYNVAYGDHGGQHRDTGRRRIANDALPADEWAAFCAKWIANLLRGVGGAIYCCMSTKEWPTVSRLFAEQGAHWSDTIIWAKDRHVLGRADYQRAYEPVWYGWPDGATRHWCGDRDQTDVWQIARPAVNELHPTQKPLPLIERAIANSSATGDVVLDLFVGSGSTLIAAERTGRRCYGLELDPHYADIVIARWEAFTGETATKETPT